MSGFIIKLLIINVLFLIQILFIKELKADRVKKKIVECEYHEKCSDCLQHFGCVWCMEPDNNSTKNHDNESTQNYCMSKSSISNCPPSMLVNPKSYKKIIAQKPLQSIQGDNVQITPQKIKLKLRLGEEHNINFQFAQAKNYPIDLYYIMDYSASMEDHRKKLAKLGNKLADTMKKITSNFRIGFGSFVDKVSMPFVSTVKEKLESPCTLNKDGYKIRCVPPYSFKNHMTLDTNHTKFSIEISEAQVSGNLDTPEGGFDAIMQAIVCKNQIGWRDQARHLLVYSSDAEFHVAGDGKLAGVLIPNDGKCHMEGNIYNDYLTYDYPSVSHLNYIAKKNNINLIFAIVKSKKDVLLSYEALSEEIENSNVGALDEKSENVIDLVLDNYNKIVDSVVIDTNATENIEIRLSSNCTKPIEKGCSDIHVGEVVDFTATIKPLTCAGYNGKPLTITFKPEAVDESLSVELEIVCDCDCENPEHPSFISNSSSCSGYGNLVCGLCDCSSGRFGSQCECDGLYSHATDDESNCIQKPGAMVCSGQGLCKCGKCECFSRSSEEEKITGKFCQCDNYSCNRDQGLLCAGKGTCSCGTCLCNAGWNGPACECPDGNSTCIRDGHLSEGVCSGRGSCNCGKCECSETIYTGKFCEECPTCRERCKEVKDCVECKVFHTGNLRSGDCDLKCTAYIIQEVDKINEDEMEQGTKMCRIIDQDSCRILYNYFYDSDKNLVIRVQKNRSCPPNALVWILGLIGSILLAGIIMLIVWKVFTTIHDRREYVKFENERKNLKWHRNENPLFISPTTTFHNPYYENK